MFKKPYTKRVASEGTTEKYPILFLKKLHMYDELKKIMLI